MTPEERSREQRQRDREEFRRAQRLDLSPIVGLLVGMGVAGAILALGWLLFEIPNYGLGG